MVVVLHQPVCSALNCAIGISREWLGRCIAPTGLLNTCFFAPDTAPAMLLKVCVNLCHHLLGCVGPGLSLSAKLFIYINLLIYLLVVFAFDGYSEPSSLLPSNLNGTENTSAKRTRFFICIVTTRCENDSALGRTKTPLIDL